MQYTSLWVMKTLHNAGPARLTTIWRFWQTEITGYLSLDFKYVTLCYIFQVFRKNVHFSTLQCILHTAVRAIQYWY